MQEAFYEIIKEASTGKVIIDNDEWNFPFDTIIYEQEKEKINYSNDNECTLIIKDEDKFFELLEEYLNLELSLDRKTPRFVDKSGKAKIKWLIMHLLANATTNDFNNPCELIERNIAFLSDHTIDFLNKELELDLKKLNNSKMIIKKNLTSTSMETPYKIDFSLRKEIYGEIVDYNLPSIYYGIDNDTCYIYSILVPKDKKNLSSNELKYQKQMNRFLYKLNSGVEDTKDYYDYKTGLSDYYPEGNISDVTHSFVLTLSTFISLLQRSGIKTVKAVSYLPMRFLSRSLASEELIDKQEELELRNDNLQNNITNKFIRTFLRVAYHNKNIDIINYPYEVDEFLSIDLQSKTKELDSMILEEVSEDIEERIK
ncbi:MAG: hypothetical protein IKE63_02285 [Bacilli bacterium]|nr:hypothetical protein [Bacilli bacterium]